MQLRIHARLALSQTNGPGRRAVLWTQGCTLNCPGCFNPRTHPFFEGHDVPVDELVTWLINLPDIEGLTISGGEPLQQQPALTSLLAAVRQRTQLSIVLFSGFTWNEIQHFSDQHFLKFIDLLVAGRYNPGQHTGINLLGSSNQSLHFVTSRYAPADLAGIPPAEVWITRQGDLTFSGVDPLRIT